MAFGRSNSLSINTGSGASPFGNTQSNTSQPQQSTSIFGSTPSQPAQQQQSGGLFGNTATSSQPQQSGGLFGSSQPASGGLFGASTQQPQQQSGGLFGASAQQPQSQPQQSGSLFGASTQQSQSQPQQSGGLFGGALGQSQNQPQQSGGLFGGGLGQSQNSQPQQGGGLFGGLGGAQNKPATGSLFGGGNVSQQPANNTQQPAAFGASLFNSNTQRNALGSLTMGQGNAPQNTVPGTKIDLSNLRPTTRFSDLHDDLKTQIEAIDAFIRKQESYSAQCEALLPNHSANVDSIKPDVDLITGKIETVELALENDSRAIESAKALVKRDASDLMRCARVAENLTLPSQYHYGPSVTAAARSRVPANTADDDNYDVDLVGYFMRQADSMQATLDTYTQHMAEIENHLRVIEVSTIQQAQQLAAQRTGSRASNAQDTVRELAETLRGFEHGILGAAGLVGSCREGVNELILGRIGGETREPQGYGARRSVRF